MDEHNPEDCPMREAVKAPAPPGRGYIGSTKMLCTTCGLEFYGVLRLTEPMCEGTFHIDGKPEGE